MRVFHSLQLMLPICLGGATSSLHATIYKLEDQVNRVTIYSNMPISPVPIRTEIPKLPPPNAAVRGQEAPLPQPVPQQPQPPPAASTGSSTPAGTEANTDSGTGAKPIGSALNDYPRISPVVQKTRDSERLAILRHELQMEETALADAVSRNAAAETIRRFKTNIDALKREIRSAR